MAGGGSSAEFSPWQRTVGITLAILSCIFIGTSFILKKKGLLHTQHSNNEHAYLKDKMWWAGMILMSVGEVANFAAYAFAPAILVAPLGAMSVVITAFLSSVILKEHLDFSSKIGCTQCILGAVIIVLNAPEGSSTTTLDDFFSYVLAPGFLVYSLVVLFVVLYLSYYLGPRIGEKNVMVHLGTCSLVGSYLVLSTQGFGSAIVHTARYSSDPQQNQFYKWPMYPLMAFVVLTILLQINYLNKALNVFSAAIVTPIYYVTFTSATIISSSVLFRGLNVSSPIAAISMIVGFLVIVGGVSLLYQYNVSLMKFSSPRISVHQSLSLPPKFEEKTLSSEFNVDFTGEMREIHREASPRRIQFNDNEQFIITDEEHKDYAWQ